LVKAREVANKLTELEAKGMCGLGSADHIGRASTLTYAIAARRKTVLDVS
jgi:hypothetical protein